MQIRFHPTAFWVAGAVAVTVWLTACQGGSSSADKIDLPSNDRLAQITEGQLMVMSCKMKTVPEPFPLGEKGRELARAVNAILVEVPRSDYQSVLETDGVKKVAVWGAASDVRKLDHWLQIQLLNAWASDRAMEISCLARFKNGSTGLKEKLEAVVARPRTVAGGLRQYWDF